MGLSWQETAGRSGGGMGELAGLQPQPEHWKKRQSKVGLSTEPGGRAALACSDKNRSHCLYPVIYCTVCTPPVLWNASGPEQAEVSPVATLTLTVPKR